MSLHPSPNSPARLRRRPPAVALALLAGALLTAGLAGCSGAETKTAHLPGDFPQAVQLPDGTVTAAAKNAGAWTASVQLDRDATRQSALEQLTEHGFSIIGESGTHGNDRVYSLAGDGYSVRVGVTTVDGHDVLNYTVAERRDRASAGAE